uniref:Uncharacterized protein n=1 Tax=Lactuca sativa TaxID=4236 RepID=A0A9R1WGK5_LACSA|nr:hypothetical protein LSAT_V11C200075400 [Lactuca sativa]
MTMVMMITLKTMRHCTTTTTGTGRSVESIRWSTVGRYRVDVASFESLALPELQVLDFRFHFQFKEDTDLFVIDEVGKMELFSSLFFPAVLRVLESKKINLWWLFLPTVNRREREREDPCILNIIYLFIYFLKVIKNLINGPCVVK